MQTVSRDSVHATGSPKRDTTFYRMFLPLGVEPDAGVPDRTSLVITSLCVSTPGSNQVFGCDVSTLHREMYNIARTR